MNSTLRWALFALTLAGAMVGGAQYMEHELGLEPCPLCLMQRVWTILAGAFIVAGLAHDPRLPSYPLAAIVCTIAGAGFSVRQLWLQSLPADAVPACGPDMAYMIDAFPLGEILKAMTLGTGNCAEVSWTLLGISIAGWALLGFIALVVTIGMWLAAQRNARHAK
jgi:disulfide bond formation protein DsbB